MLSLYRNGICFFQYLEERKPFMEDLIITKNKKENKLIIRINNFFNSLEYINNNFSLMDLVNSYILDSNITDKSYLFKKITKRIYKYKIVYLFEYVLTKI